MRKSKPKDEPSTGKRSMRPATTVEARENQLVSLAVDLAERQLLDGTASSQVISHYLKLGSTKEKLDYEFKKKQMELIEAKTGAIHSAQKIEDLYDKAIAAMRGYNGQDLHEASDEY